MKSSPWAALPAMLRKEKRTQCARADKAVHRMVYQVCSWRYMMLPIYEARDDLARLFSSREHQAIVVVGPTGSGKTTVLPIFLFEHGFAERGMIGITEPRRIAATSVAGYVAREFGPTMGGQRVGYQVRHDTDVAPNTAIKFMTDGILLREIQVDPGLSKYSVIMIDEAHERSENIDFLLGILKDLLKRRSDLKVVVASATIDADKFSRYFGNAPIVSVSGRTYPVQVIYGDRDLAVDGFRYEPGAVVKAAVDKVREIHLSGLPGDVLVFMTGQDDIGLVIDGIKKLGFGDLVALPAYGGLDPAEQEKIFWSFPGKRKVIVATNVAETSLTVDGIVYVVDSGLIKQAHFHPETGIQSLDVVPHSQAGCDQRSGRAGRTRPGVCYRLYTEANFHERPKYTEPEIRRVSLASVVLTMEDLGIGDVENFDFVDAPDRKAFHEAYETLIALGAITSSKRRITELGRRMARLPLEPRLARMLLEAEKYGCVEEVATVAAFLATPHGVFVRPREPREKQFEADRVHSQFKDERSDALTCLRVWRGYVNAGYCRDWCYGHFLNARALYEIERVREQLLSILERGGMVISQSHDEEKIMQSVVAGLLYNLLEHDTRYWYKGVFRSGDFSDICIHPGSSLFGGYRMSRWLVATEVVETTKRFARNCTEVKLEWLVQLAPQLFTYGEMEIESFEPGDQAVTVRQSVMCRGVKVGTTSREIPPAEARRLQSEKIRNAEAQNWKKLTFRKVRDWPLDTILVSAEGYRVLSSYGYEAGVPYYCDLEFFAGKWFAHPKFRVFDLRDQDEKVPVAEAAQELMLTLGGSAINMGKLRK